MMGMEKIRMVERGEGVTIETAKAMLAAAVNNTPVLKGKLDLTFQDAESLLVLKGFWMGLLTGQECYRTRIPGDELFANISIPHFGTAVLQTSWPPIRESV